MVVQLVLMFSSSNIAFNFKGMDVGVPSSTATPPSLCPPLTASRDKRNKDWVMCSDLTSSLYLAQPR